MECNFVIKHVFISLSMWFIVLLFLIHTPHILQTFRVSQSSFSPAVTMAIVASFYMCLSNNQNQILLDLVPRIILPSFLIPINNRSLILLVLGSRIVRARKAHKVLVPGTKLQPRFVCNITTWNFVFVLDKDHFFWHCSHGLGLMRMKCFIFFKFLFSGQTFYLLTRIIFWKLYFILDNVLAIWKQVGTPLFYYDSKLFSAGFYTTSSSYSSVSF